MFSGVHMYSLLDEKSEEEDTEDQSDNEGQDPIQKYKALLESIENKEDKKKNKDMEMEITWGLGIKDKAEELVKKKISEGELTHLLISLLMNMLLKM